MQSVIKPLETRKDGTIKNIFRDYKGVLEIKMITTT